MQSEIPVHCPFVFPTHSLRYGYLFLKLPCVPQLWWTALRGPRVAPSTSQSYAVGAPQGTDGSGIFPVSSRHRHGRPSSGGREHGEPDCWPRFQPTGCAGGFPASQSGKAVSDPFHRCCAKPRACPHRVPVHFVRTPSGG